MLAWDRFRQAVGGGTPADDRFAKNITIEWATLRDDYFEALRLVALPILRIFGTMCWYDPDHWLTGDEVKEQYSHLRMNMLRLFDEA